VERGPQLQEVRTKFTPTQSAQIEALDQALHGFACERKRMFGAVAYFVNNNMFAGAHQNELFLRLPADDRQKLMQEYDEVSAFEPMPGKKMAEYVAVPDSVSSQPGMLSLWIDRSYRYASALAPKQRKPKKESP